MTCEELALRLVSREGRIRQDHALTELSGGFDTYRSSYYRALESLIAAGVVGMEWDAYGYPYYTASVTA